MSRFEIIEHPDAREVFVAAYRDRPDVENIESMLRAWEVCALVLGGVVIGAVAGKGAYFHIGVLPASRRKWATRGRLRQIAEWAYARGYTLTKVRANSVGAKMATIGGMALKQRIAGGCEYAYAP